MEQPKRVDIDIELSPKQEKLAALYKRATGKTVLWVKKGKVRVLDPDEIIIL